MAAWLALALHGGAGCGGPRGSALRAWAVLAAGRRWPPAAPLLAEPRVLAELERALAVDSAAASSNPDPAGPMVSVDSLRAYLQIVDVASILRLDRDIADHAFDLFKDCSSATCLRNRSVEALATAALVQAIREAQQPRTLQVCL